MIPVDLSHLPFVLMPMDRQCRTAASLAQRRTLGEGESVPQLMAPRDGNPELKSVGQRS